jgi:hypothetical protein
MADAQFRMQIPSVIMGIGGDGSGPPDHGTSSPVEIYASDASGRAPNAISIPVTIAGATGTEVVTLDAPSGAAWIPDGAGSGTISWPSAMIGTHEVTIHVADAGGQEKASKTISLIVHGPLTASVPQSTYLPKVGDALAIAPTVQNLIAGPGSARWGASPAPFPSWLALDDVSGTVAVDTTTAHVAAELELTAVDQTDMASASTMRTSISRPLPPSPAPTSRAWPGRRPACQPA